MKIQYLFIPAIFALASLAQGANLWQTDATPTPTPLLAPVLETFTRPSADQTATPTPGIAVPLKALSPTPTPQPGLKAKSPAQAAIFSAILPGSGQVYNEDPLRGLVLAGLFGVGLWQTLDNFSLHPESPGSSVMVVKDEDLGSIIGLGTLAVYGYGIQDALNGATQYNKNHYLTFSIGLQPRPGASLAFRF